MGYRPLVKKFAQRVVTTAVNVVAKVGFFFEIMEFLKLGIYIANNGYISLNQGFDSDDAYAQGQIVQITPDMVDKVCEELQRLKRIIQENNTQDDERLD